MCANFRDFFFGHLSIYSQPPQSSPPPHFADSGANFLKDSSDPSVASQINVTDVKTQGAKTQKRRKVERSQLGLPSRHPEEHARVSPEIRKGLLPWVRGGGNRWDFTKMKTRAWVSSASNRVRLTCPFWNSLPDESENPLRRTDEKINQNLLKCFCIQWWKVRGMLSGTQETGPSGKNKYRNQLWVGWIGVLWDKNLKTKTKNCD